MSESLSAKMLRNGPKLVPNCGFVLSVASFLAFSCCPAPITLAVDVDAAAASDVRSPTAKTARQPKDSEATHPEAPWDFSPYRVLIWIASDGPNVSADVLRDDLNAYLNRDFLSIWRTTIADAPRRLRPQPDETWRA